MGMNHETQVQKHHLSLLVHTHHSVLSIIILYMYRHTYAVLFAIIFIQYRDAANSGGTRIGLLGLEPVFKNNLGANAKFK